MLDKKINIHFCNYALDIIGTQIYTSKQVRQLK